MKDVFVTIGWNIKEKSFTQIWHFQASTRLSLVPIFCSPAHLSEHLDGTEALEM